MHARSGSAKAALLAICLAVVALAVLETLQQISAALSVARTHGAMVHCAAAAADLIGKRFVAATGSSLVSVFHASVFFLSLVLFLLVTPVCLWRVHRHRRNTKSRSSS